MEGQPHLTYARAGPALARIPVAPMITGGDPDSPVPAPAAAPPTSDQLRARIESLLADRQLMEAIALASPSTARTCRRPIAELPVKRLRSLAASLTGYSARMRARATPFGLFAGVTLAYPAEASRAAIEMPTQHQRVARPDAAWLEAITNCVERSDEGLERLAYIANPAAQRVGESFILRSPEARTSRVSLRAKPAVIAALDVAGEPTAGSRIRAAARAHAKTEEGALAALRTLVRHHYLISELRPPAHSCDPLGHVIGCLRHRRLRPDLVRALEQFGAALTAYAAAPVGTAEAALRRAHETGHATTQIAGAAGAPGEQAGLLHVDTLVSADIALGPRVFDEAQQAAGVLARFAGSRDRRDLQQHLDQTSGGYGIPLPEVSCPPSSAAVPAAHPALLEAYVTALREGRTEIVLDDALLDAIAPADATRPVPDMDLYAVIRAADTQAMDQGQFELHIHRPACTSAGTALARFAPLLGEAGHDALRAITHVTDEAASAGCGEPVLAADVTFRPRQPAAENVSRVALTRPARISTNSPPGGEPAPGSTLTPQDLLLFPGPDGPEVWSQRLGMRVLPRATTALNTETTAPYSAHVLAVATGQNSALGFDWGILAESPWLPRVRRGRTVYSPQTWRLGADLVRRSASSPSWYERFARWSERWSLPARVTLAEGDRQMPLSPCDPVDLSILRRHAEKGEVTLTEAFGEQDCWARSPLGLHLVEAVFPMVAVIAGPRPPHGNGAAAHGAAVVVPPQRPRPSPPVLPGGSWLRARLACPGKRHPALLRDLAGTLAGRDWFFTRQHEDHLDLCVRLGAWTPTDWSCLLDQLAGTIAAAEYGNRDDALSILTYRRDAGFRTPALHHELLERWAMADSYCTLAAMLADAPDAPLLSTVQLAREIAQSSGSQPLAAIAANRRAFSPLRRRLLPLLTEGDIVPPAGGDAGALRRHREERAAAMREYLLRLRSPMAARHVGGLLLRQHAERLAGGNAAGLLALAAAAEEAASSSLRAIGRNA
jgi:lantibiotic biosynthesis protein